VVTQEPETNERSIDFMLEEFRYLKASYEGAMTWRDERFRSFINIIFGTAALLAIIAQLSKTKSELYYSIIVITVILYLYGLFVFSRLVAGSFSTEQYRRAINRVRAYFVDLDATVKEYLLVPIDNPEPTTEKSRLGSGLIGTTAFTNSLLLLFIGTTILQVANWQILPSIAIGLGLAFTNWVLHTAYYGGQVKKHAKEDNAIPK
jgi:hypothetical protein